MFCPKCGKKQISDFIRFCSRCGFQLNVVKTLLADDASRSENPEPVAERRWRRKRDMTIGAALMCIMALHTAWTTEDLSLEREYMSLVLKCLVLFALINLVPVIRDFFCGGAARDGSSSPGILSGIRAKFENGHRAPALPAADGKPAADYFTGRINTADLVPPPSVTEKTTALLRNNPN